MKLSKSSISEKEIEAVVAVLKNEFLGMGPLVKKFEDALSNYIGNEVYVACLNTGTSALHAAIIAMDIKNGDEVLVPGLTFVASFQAISATGAKPVACDVNPNTGLIDLNDAKKKINKHTKAIMYVHYASELGNLDELYAFAKNNQIRVIEDAAHSFGSMYHGKMVGSMGDVVCFSFDGIKNITCAEGGAVVTRDKVVFERVKNIRLLGVVKDSENRYQKKRSWDFDVEEQGFRYHMGEMNAAIGLVQLERLQHEFREKRVLLASYYREKLKNVDCVKLFETSHGQNKTEIVPHILPVKVLGKRRDELKEYLQSHGIETGIHYKPSHLLSFYGRGKEKLPEVESVYSQLLTLPLQVNLELKGIDRLVELIKNFQ